MKKNGKRGSFKRCVKAVSKRGGAYDPKAVCAASERKRGLLNRGKKKTRHNPMDGAVDVYQQFHGKPASEVIEVKTRVHYHKHLAALGKLEYLKVAAVNGQVITIERFGNAVLCSNESSKANRDRGILGTQLFIEGGDQSVNPKTFGVETEHEVETLGEVVELGYFTDKVHLGDEGGKAIYFHHMGEEGKRRRGKDGRTVYSGGFPPDLIYRVRDSHLEFSGGSYRISPEGIVN